MNNNSRKFSCMNCGHTYESYPPNDVFNIALPNQCEKEDCMEIRYDCEDCHQTYSIFWDRKHIKRVVVSTKRFT